MKDNTVKTIAIIFLIIAIFWLMHILSGVLQPLALAFLISLLFQPLMEKLSKWKIPEFIILPVVTILSLGVLFTIGLIITNSMLDIYQERAFLGERLMSKFQDWGTSLVNTFHLQKRVAAFQQDIFSVFDFRMLSNLTGGIISELSDFVAYFFMFSLYYIMFLVSLRKQDRFIKYVGGGGERGEKLLKQFKLIHKNVIDYINIKSLMGILKGICVYIICISFGIKFPVFWAFLIYVMNFIPSIGSIIGAVFPSLMALVQLDSGWGIFFFIILIAGTDSVIGNLVEPIFMGRKMSMNTITVILGMVFWGVIWGLTGMILSVPLFVIMRIIFEHIPSLAFLARLMGSSKDTELKGEDAVAKV
ncbi:MAG: AI-2E family transporter [bacterium]